MPSHPQNGVGSITSTDFSQGCEGEEKRDFHGFKQWDILPNWLGWKGKSQWDEKNGIHLNTKNPGPSEKACGASANKSKSNPTPYHEIPDYLVRGSVRFRRSDTYCCRGR
jgi:hypothetical protein